MSEDSIKISLERLGPPRVPDRAEQILANLRQGSLHERLADGDRFSRGAKIGRFTLLEILGRGGMSVVYSAYDDKLDRKIAIKLLRADTDSPEYRHLLEREARTLARLSHPNVVQVYDVGEHDAGEHGRTVYIAMEYVRGVTMRRWMEDHPSRRGRAYTDTVVLLFRAVGLGLQAAHDAHLVHRDFKPDNVLINGADHPRVVDFGLARSLSRVIVGQDDSQRGASHDAINASSMTSRGRLMGTPAYMSPEQLRGEPADARSDQFSFCVALYEVLSGERPFHGDTVAELQSAMESGPPTNPGTIPPPVFAVLERGLSADPSARFPDIRALVDSLYTGRRRTRLLLGTGIFAMVLAMAFAAASLFLTSPDRVTDTCGSISERMDEQWNTARHESLHRAFIDTRLPFAKRTWNTTRYAIDGYVDDWKRAWVSVCGATLSESVQSAAVLKARVVCLEHSRAQLSTVLHLFEDDNNGSNIAAAHDLVASLPHLSRCDDPEPFGRQISEVSEIRQRLQHATNLRLIGQVDEALRIAQEQLLAAEVIGYPQVRAEALFEVGRGLVEQGHKNSPRLGVTMLEIARQLATQSGDLYFVAKIRTDLVRIAFRYDKNTERGRDWYTLAAQSIREIGNPPLLHSKALRWLALLDLRDGKFVDAERRLREALRSLGGGTPAEKAERAMVVQQLGTVMRDQNNLDEASLHYQDAERLLSSVVGVNHPNTIEVRFDIAVLHGRRGDLESAHKEMQKVLDEHRAVYEKDHWLIGKACIELADILRQRGLFTHAHQMVDEGLAIYNKVYSAGHRRFDKGYVLLGAISYRRGDYAGALDAYNKALSILQESEDATHLDVGFAQANIAEAMVALGRSEDALVALRAAQHTTLSQLGDPVVKAFLLSVSGRAHLIEDNHERAVGELAESAQLFDQLDGGTAALERADAYWALAQAYDGVADRTRGVAFARKALALYERQPEAHAPNTTIRLWIGQENKRGPDGD